MKGFGTVVTGTLLAGTIRKEEELEVFPAGKRVRVRGVQVHGSPSEAAVAGQRTALNLNLAGLSTEDLGRGMTLATADIFHSTSRVDVLLSLLPSAKALKNGARVHFHAYTTETIAQARLHGMNQLKSGEEAYAQLRFAEPMLLLPGDRFIVRQFSPVVTIGGGAILDASPATRKQRVEDRTAFLKIMRSRTSTGSARRTPGSHRHASRRCTRGNERPLGGSGSARSQGRVAGLQSTAGCARGIRRGKGGHT
jgi:selenocysteine-specific elongation factor